MATPARRPEATARSPLTPAWRSPPARPSMRPGRVDVWRIDAAQGRVRERSHAARREILANYLACPATAIDFGRGPSGKPYLATPRHDLVFNLSHAGDVALFAVASGLSLGVDVERVRPLTDPLRIARRVMPPNLLELVAAAPAADRLWQFFRCWTRHEAAQKAFGRGVFAAPVPGHWYRALEFAAAAGYVASIAVAPPGAGLAVRYFDWVDG